MSLSTILVVALCLGVAAQANPLQNFGPQNLFAVSSPCASADLSSFHCPADHSETRSALYADPNHPCSPYFIQCAPNQVVICQNCPQIGPNDFLYFHQTPNPPNNIPTGYCDYKANVPACSAPPVTSTGPESTTTIQPAPPSTQPPPPPSTQPPPPPSTQPPPSLSTQPPPPPSTQPPPSPSTQPPPPPSTQPPPSPSTQPPPPPSTQPPPPPSTQPPPPPSTQPPPPPSTQPPPPPSTQPPPPPSTQPPPPPSTQPPPPPTTTSVQTGCAMPNPPCLYGGLPNLVLLDTAYSWRLADGFWHHIANVSSERSCNALCCVSEDCITAVYASNTQICHMTSVSSIIANQCQVHSQTTLQCSSACGAYQKVGYCNAAHSSTYSTIDTSFLCQNQQPNSCDR